MGSRVWHAAIVVVVLIAIVVQIVITVRIPGVPHSTATGLLRGSSTAGRIVRVLSFFTIQSNLLTALSAATVALRPDRDGRAFRVLRLASLVGITVTGIVYSAVLDDVHEPLGTTETFVNALVHYVVPVAAVVGWISFGPRRRIDVPAVVGALLFPLIWLGYTLIRGAIWGWYPYPFLDVKQHGYAGVVLNSVAVTVVFLVVAFAFFLGETLLGAVARRRRPNS